jgi:hypothetical protein
VNGAAGANSQSHDFHSNLRMSWAKPENDGKQYNTLDRPKTAIVQNPINKKKIHENYKVVFESQLENDDYHPFQNQEDPSRNLSGGVKRPVFT